MEKLEISGKKVLLFLGITFGFSWLAFLPNIWAAEALTTLPLLLLRIVASFGPVIAAIIVLGKQEGIQLLKSSVNFAGKAKWIIGAIVLSLLVVIIPTAVLIFQGGLSLDIIPAGRWLLLVPNFILSLLFLGSVADEIGWRGYLLPRLQTRYSALISSIIIGILWALWQLPTYYFVGVAEALLSPLWMILEIVGLSVILTWLYNSSQSLSTVIIFNGIYRTLVSFLSPALQLSGNNLNFQQFTAIVLVNFALIIVLLCGSKDLVFKYKPRRSNS